MNAAQIVELVFRIIAMLIVSASVIGIVVYGAQGIINGMDDRRAGK